MDHLFSTPPVLVSFSQIYTQNIQPKLQEIDIFLKSEETPYKVHPVAMLLGMSVEEILEIMAHHNINQLDKTSFFLLVSYSSSYICRLIQRQWKYSHTPFYTSSIICTIYELGEDKVLSAFSQLGKEYIDEHELPELFRHIKTPLFRM